MSTTFTKNNTLRETKRTLVRKVALITGATRGIGKAIAEELHANNYHVVIFYKNEDRETREVIKEMYKKLKNISFFKVDVSNAEEVDTAFKQIKKQCGKIDVVVSNAGIIDNTKDETLENITKIKLQKFLDTNFFGGGLRTQKVYPLLEKKFLREDYFY